MPLCQPYSRSRDDRRSKTALPRLWLFTDARTAARLDQDIAALPEGSGVIFRHYHLAEAERKALFHDLMQRHAHRDVAWIWSGDAWDVAKLHADGSYSNAGERRAGPLSQRQGLWLAAAHSMTELAQAARCGADAVFLSPVCKTRSHPGAKTLGPMRFAALARFAACPVYALGGVTAENIRRIETLCHGWGAIDGLSGR